ncbi:hypothetical protein ACEZ3G_11340 [Maribacter algicola]|uniref:Uncharacterized protein n=1 Tax=Meishania litoralis TaxID=3434685 RepID=A0ACC7LKN3_9FLAO
MEKIYAEQLGKNRLFKVGPETVRFLLDYSKSLYILEHKQFKFENVMN